MSRFTICCCLVLYLSGMQGQNYVPNSSFENGNDNSSSSYNAGLEDLDNWQNFGTSDWYKNFDVAPLATGGVAPGANTGVRFIGFGPCEGAQVKLNSIPPSYSSHFYVTTSFYYQTRQNVETSINYYLLEKKADGITNCFDDKDFSNGVGGEVNVAFGSDNSWKLYQEDLTSTLNVVKRDKFNWFAIKGEHIFGVHSANEYLYIDDVTVKFTDYCSHPCAGNKVGSILGHYSVEDNGTINEIYDENVGNAIRTWSTTKEIALVSLKNANWVKLTIVNRWGEFDEFEWFDPNGLTNSKYTNSFQSSSLQSFINNRSDLFTVVWTGKLNGEEYEDENVYTITLETSNCNDYKSYSWAHTQFGRDNHPEPSYPKTAFLEPNCCKPGDKIYTSIVPWTMDQYQGSIIFNTDAQFTSNKVYVGEAGVSIEMGPNTTFAPTESGYIDLSIQGLCAQGSALLKMQGTDKGATLETWSLNSESGEIEVYPNPVQHELNLKVREKRIEKVVVTSLSGSKIMSTVFTKGESNVVMDVSTLEKGVYLLRIELKDNSYEYHKVIKQ